MKTRTPSIQESTHDYETWLSGEMPLVPEDLELKHRHMQEGLFPFLRATYYRWAQRWPEVCGDLLRAPEVLAVGDLHVENFGTWRDSEGRLVWGINDFDEATPLPYTQDLVRLATSAHVAIAGSKMAVGTGEADEAILAGYRAALEHGGRPFVLAEHASALREMAGARLREPEAFWRRLDALPDFTGQVPAGAVKAISQNLPKPDLPRRLVHRVAGLGSLGRERFVAIAEWQGAKIAREAKALAPSAATWAHGASGQTKILYRAILERSLRSADPWVHIKRRWIVRRLAPDCSRIELSELGAQRDELHLLRAMGWETANIHLGSRSAHALLVDLVTREEGWLHQAAKHMLHEVENDWEAWRRDPRPVPADRIKLESVTSEAGAKGKKKGKKKKKKSTDGKAPGAEIRVETAASTAGKQKIAAKGAGKGKIAAKAAGKQKSATKAAGKPKAAGKTAAKRKAAGKTAARRKAAGKEKTAAGSAAKAKGKAIAKAGAKSAGASRVAAKPRSKPRAGAKAKGRTAAQSAGETRAQAGQEIVAEAENRTREQAAAPAAGSKDDGASHEAPTPAAGTPTAEG